MKPDSTVYRGARTGCGDAIVTVDNRVLAFARSIAIRNHSPTGFEWGYMGSGPSQLALAMLLDFTGDPARAEREYQSFKQRFVAAWDGDLWTLTGLQIRTWLEAREPAAILVTSDVT